MKIKYVFKYLNDFPSSDDWFPHEHIDSALNKKVEKNQGTIRRG